VIALTDLTALRHAEQARLELQARLSALTDALHEAVLLHDPGRGRLVYASHRLLEWLPAPLAPADNLASLIEAIDPADQGRRWPAGTTSARTSGHSATGCAPPTGSGGTYKSGRRVSASTRRGHAWWRRRCWT